MALAETLMTAINNPECSILTGMWIGAAITLKFTVALAVLQLVFKAMEKLALEPLIAWAKKKIYKVNQ